MEMVDLPSRFAIQNGMGIAIQERTKKSAQSIVTVDIQGMATDYFLHTPATARLGYTVVVRL